MSLVRRDTRFSPTTVLQAMKAGESWEQGNPTGYTICSKIQGSLPLYRATSDGGGEESWEQDYPTGYTISEIPGSLPLYCATSNGELGGEGYPTDCEISYCCL